MLLLIEKSVRDSIEALLFIVACGDGLLFHASFQTANHGRGEPGVLHLVEAADGETARGAHLVNLGFGVVAVGLQQVNGTLQGL